MNRLFSTSRAPSMLAMGIVLVAALTVSSGCLRAVVAKAKVPPPVAKPVVRVRVSPREADTKSGVIILMYHKFGDKETRYTRSFEHFRHDIQRLYDLGFRPVTMTQYLEDKMDLAPGASPVVFTFDDSQPSQFQLMPDGTVDPYCAVGIWKEFEAAHPDFPLRATWYVLPGMWGQKDDRNKKVEMLREWGSELGSHTWTHPMLNKMTDEQVKRQLALSLDMIEGYGFTNVPFAYPYGLLPQNVKLLQGFDYKGKHYSVTSGVLADTDIACGPEDKRLKRYHIPRVEATEGLLGLDYWLDRVESNKSSVYVSP